MSLTNIEAYATTTGMKVANHFRRNRLGWIIFAVGVVPVYALSAALAPDLSRYRVSAYDMQLDQLSSNLLAALGGFAAGFVVVGLLYLLRRFKDVALALIALGLLFVVLKPGVGNNLTTVTAGVFGLAGLVVGWNLLMRSASRRPTTFGSAEWADFTHIGCNGLFNPKGFWLGEFPVPPEVAGKENETTLLRYGRDRHLLTVAPTRAGKGVSTIIPNLLTYPGSTLVIDPKGENALITAVARHKLGQEICIVDPWGIVAPQFRMASARFNPLDWLREGDPDLNENAMLLADALVLKSGGKDQFWDEESKALLMGLILHVATDKGERETRNLARVREKLMLDDKDQEALFQKMYNAENPVVASTGARCMQKDPKLLSNVLAAAQAHTHFLDSPRIRENLAHSDFRFEDLKSAAMTIYLVLPADRLNTFGRWLRLLIQQAITVNARNIAHKPENPVLFILDEMPALGHLTMVEQAYGLMAGFGMQLWGIVQDLSQLERIYGKGWQTFVANSGVLQYFGSRDQMSAEYFSKLCGVTTLKTLSTTFSQAVSSVVGGGSTTTTGTTVADAQRNLAYPDELMTLKKGRQLLLVENMNPIAAEKIVWYEHPALKDLGLNLHELQRQREERKAASALEPAA